MTAKMYVKLTGSIKIPYLVKEKCQQHCITLPVSTVIHELCTIHFARIRESHDDLVKGLCPCMEVTRTIQGKASTSYSTEQQTMLLLK